MNLLLVAVPLLGMQWRVNMKVYTVRIGRWKLAKKEKIPVMDISLSNRMFIVLKPSRALLDVGIKPIDQDEFAAKHMLEMYKSYRENIKPWLCILKNSKIAIGVGSSFVERVYLNTCVAFLKEIAFNHGLVIEDGGELAE